jgi:hypothetical protein
MSAPMRARATLGSCARRRWGAHEATDTRPQPCPAITHQIDLEVGAMLPFTGPLQFGWCGCERLSEPAAPPEADGAPATPPGPAPPQQRDRVLRRRILLRRRARRAAR